MCVLEFFDHLVQTELKSNESSQGEHILNYLLEKDTV